MKLLKPHRNQVHIEELGNASLHFLGALSSVIGLVLMSMLIRGSDSISKWVSVITFGGSLILMFMASTFYHLEKDSKRKKRLKVLDHCAIFFLIAGTYTPFMLLTLHSIFSYTLLSIIWTIALGGSAYKLFFVYHYPKLSTALYLIMGWLALTAIVPLYHQMNYQGLFWLVAGGISYTVGVIFYLWKRLYFSHAIWHLFVIGGSACHFWSIYHYVLPYPT